MNTMKDTNTINQGSSSLWWEINKRKNEYLIRSVFVECQNLNPQRGMLKNSIFSTITTVSGNEEKKRINRVAL